jgi:hypothetical protein
MLNRASIELIPLRDVPDDQEFWRGSLFRLYEVGMNVKDKTDDFYEYMLVLDNSFPGFMILANSSREAGQAKRGAVICHVQLLEKADRAVVTGAAMKYSFGTEHTYWVKE